MSSKYIAFPLLILTNNILLFYAFLSQYLEDSGFILSLSLKAISCIFLIYVWLRIQILPVSTEEDASARAKIIYGGRRLLHLSLALSIVQFFILFGYGYFTRTLHIEQSYFIYNNILAFALIFLIFLNGWLRIFILSVRLRLVRRAVVAMLIWIPIVNIAVILYMCRIAMLEYDHSCNMTYNHNMRRESLVCKTKYPLLLLHGVGFRDFKYVNYWGRIPKNLIKNGATIYYGHQEAFGTIQDNAAMVREKIIEIIQKTGCEKVNIIAHSKGGLDARYTISSLGMGEYVASLTTISTPHRGSFLVDFANERLSEKAYKSVANFFDKRFLKIGDKNPDFYRATQQFTKEYAEKFNIENLDVEGVYYQSYMSVMKNCFSHTLLTIPYQIMCRSDKVNDGLVSLESAKWGEFRQVFTSKRLRGISHGDIIDLGRQDYKGFNVIETYINIVSELKTKGF